MYMLMIKAGGNKHVVKDTFYSTVRSCWVGAGGNHGGRAGRTASVVVGVGRAHAAQGMVDKS